MFGINPISSAPFVTVSKENLIAFIINQKPIITLERRIFRLFSIISNTIAFIWIGQSILLLTNTVNCGIILSRLINRSFNLISSITTSLQEVVISFVNFANNKVIYARSIVKEITSIKFRTLFINKDNRL